MLDFVVLPSLRSTSKCFLKVETCCFGSVIQAARIVIEFGFQKKEIDSERDFRQPRGFTLRRILDG